MLSKLKQNILTNIKNIPGWHTKRKIIIIECDDWGGIRMPSKDVFESLSKRGLSIKGWFNKYDTLETKEDLEMLFNILDSVKDKNNRPAVITPITNVANPDFEKIKSCNFTEYHFEAFTETLNRYYPNTDVFKLWKEGITAGIFLPELHGREHITVQIWMEKLREGNKDLLTAFDHGFTSLDIPDVKRPAREFRAEFYFTNEEHIPFLFNSIKEGISLFMKIFGYMPQIFVPSNGIFHPIFETVAGKNGIKFIYVNHTMPYPTNGGDLKYRHFISGQKGPEGISYYTRNCAFEPCDPRYKGIESTLKQVTAAFRWGKPASISTHRANFAGGIEPTIRHRGLKELKRLLNALIQKWPDIEFMNSRDALEHMRAIN